MRQESLYVLRLWLDSNHSDAWRASLEDIRSKEKVRFSSLKELYRFLEGRRGAGEENGDE
ncbi:hypothetical protein BH24DEI2_BH24DEI2_14920 [soil metagenome]